MQKKVKENVTTVECTGTLERNVGSYAVTLTKAMVLDVQILRNPMTP